MLQPHAKIFIHIVFATRNRNRFLIDPTPTLTF